jgi:hypothetical protein
MPFLLLTGNSESHTLYGPMLSENNKIIVVLSADTNIIIVSVIDRE